MDEEFRLHMLMRTEHLMQSGVPPAEAKRQARVEFGSVDRYREEGRASRGLLWLDELRSDLRYAIRSLRKAPGFTAVAVLTLALGVGANTSVFSMVSATVLRPVPFAEPDRLVAVYQTRQSLEGAGFPTRWSYPEFDAVRKVARSSDLAAYYADDVNLSGVGAEPVRMRAELVSASYMSVLGVSPAIGRGFLSADDGSAATPVVLISDDVWNTMFGGTRQAIGQSVTVNGVAATVIGVAPAGFRGLSGRSDIWLTHASAPRIYMADYLTSGQRFLGIVGRIRPGTSIQQAQAELAGSGTRAAAAARAALGSDMNGAAWHTVLLPLDKAGRDPTRIRAQIALSGAALFVMLIAGINLSSLLLARSVARARESAVRAALGAGRLRLLRHALVEGGVLGLLGGTAGLMIGVWSVRLLANRISVSAGTRPFIGDLSSTADPTVDWRVLVFTMAVATAAGMLAAVGAAWRGTRGEMTDGLKTSARGNSIRIGSLRRPTVLTAAALGQITCSLLLLVGAALLIDGFRQLRSIESGFDPRGVIAFTISAPATQYDNTAAAALLERILERVQAVPGVQYATVSLCRPLRQCSSTQLFISGREQSDEAPAVGRHYVGPDHFRTLGVPLLRGRSLSEHDRAGAQRVAVINETAARRYWPGEDPIGKRVWFGGGGGFASPDSLTEIVGVAEDVLYGTPGDEVRPDFYTSYLQFTWPTTTVMVRASIDPTSLVAALRSAVLAVDSDLAIYDVQTLEQWGDAVLADQRFTTQALSAIAVLGLLLACLGLYGIMAWSVAQRRREIGIRVALGSTGPQVMRLVLSQGSAIVLCGVVAGIAASAALVNALRALVPHAASADPLVMGAVVVLLLLVSTVACWVPARSASRVDPARTIGEVT